MQRLEEAVLHIRACPAPPYRHGIDADRGAIQLHRLAQALHDQLLQIGRQQRKALVVGHHALRRMAQHIPVPHRRERVAHGDVVGQRRVDGMRIESRRTGQQTFEAVEADRQRDRQADRGPQRIAAAYPVPHRQHASGGDVEGRGGALGIRADGIQSLAATQPVAQDAAIEQGLLGAERLRDQDRRGTRGVQRRQRALRGGAIDVGQEMHPEASRQRIAQRIGHQPRPQVGTADADAHDVGDVAGLELCDQVRHPPPHLQRAFVRLARDGGVGMPPAQRGMQCGTVFGDVDLLTVEQAAESGGQVRLPRMLHEGLPRGRVVGLAREVEVKGSAAHGVRGHALGLARQQIAQGGATQARGVGLQRVETLAHVRRPAWGCCGWCG